MEDDAGTAAVSSAVEEGHEMTLSGNLRSFARRLNFQIWRSIAHCHLTFVRYSKCISSWSSGRSTPRSPMRRIRHIVPIQSSRRGGCYVYYATDLKSPTSTRRPLRLCFTCYEEYHKSHSKLPLAIIITTGLVDRLYYVELHDDNDQACTVTPILHSLTSSALGYRRPTIERRKLGSRC